MKIILLACLSAALCSVSFAQSFALKDVRVYPAPGTPPLQHATLLVRAGKIAALGDHVPVPAGTATLPCNGCVVFAGFWNCHVHFIESKWEQAAKLPAERLTRQLQDMLTRSGFTTVVDTGSNPADTVALRRRIDQGEVAGPRIFTAGAPLYPYRGIPYYLSDLPPSLRAILPQPQTAAEAVAAVETNIRAGSNIVKLFTGSYVKPGHVLPMNLTIAAAAVNAGHSAGQLVFAHPSNLQGVQVAVESRVDVLAHAPDTVAGVDEKVIAGIAAHGMAMIPTLKLFSQDSEIARIREIVKRFSSLGGQLLFGTDTGFLTDYGMTEEYRQLGLAGLSFSNVLAMLTAAPAACFHLAGRTGRIAPGMDADLTVLSQDPAAGDLTTFTHVRYTIREGKTIYSSE